MDPTLQPIRPRNYLEHITAKGFPGLSSPPAPPPLPPAQEDLPNPRNKHYEPLKPLYEGKIKAESLRATIHASKHELAVRAHVEATAAVAKHSKEVDELLAQIDSDWKGDWDSLPKETRMSFLSEDWDSSRPLTFEEFVKQEADKQEGANHDVFFLTREKGEYLWQTYLRAHALLQVPTTGAPELTRPAPLYEFQLRVEDNSKPDSKHSLKDIRELFLGEEVKGEVSQYKSWWVAYTREKEKLADDASSTAQTGGGQAEAYQKLMIALEAVVRGRIADPLILNYTAETSVASQKRSLWALIENATYTLEEIQDGVDLVAGGGNVPGSAASTAEHKFASDILTNWPHDFPTDQQSMTWKMAIIYLKGKIADSTLHLESELFDENKPVGGQWDWSKLPVEVGAELQKRKGGGDGAGGGAKADPPGRAFARRILAAWNGGSLLAMKPFKQVNVIRYLTRIIVEGGLPVDLLYDESRDEVWDWEYLPVDVKQELEKIEAEHAANPEAGGNEPKPIPVGHGAVATLAIRKFMHTWKINPDQNGKTIADMRGAELLVMDYLRKLISDEEIGIPDLGTDANGRLLHDLPSEINRELRFKLQFGWRIKRFLDEWKDELSDRSFSDEQIPAASEYLEGCARRYADHPELTTDHLEPTYERKFPSLPDEILDKLRTILG